MDNYRQFNCFGSFNWQSTRMMREKMKLKGLLSQGTLQNCVPWAHPLCILGSFSRDQSRIKRDNIIYKKERPNLSYPLQLVLLERNFSAFLPKAASSILFSPVCHADMNSCRDIVTLSCITPIVFRWPCSFHLVGMFPKKYGFEPWQCSDVEKQEPGEYSCLQKFCSMVMSFE